jgi:hypothetical protein
MSESTQQERYERQLAKAIIRAEKAEADLSYYEHMALEDKARIAELETRNKHESDCVEAAKAHIASINNQWADDVLRVMRAEAERDALRQVLCEVELYSNDPYVVKIARAALAPSPTDGAPLGRPSPE